MEATSPGQRLFLIRLACGDGLRKPESLREFAERVAHVTGVEMDHKTISMLERDQQGWRLKDAMTFAAVDPLKRGERWLAFGNESTTEGVKGPRRPRPDPRHRDDDSTSGAEDRRSRRKR